MQKKQNKNALSSVESRLLGDEFCCQRPWQGLKLTF